MFLSGRHIPCFGGSYPVLGNIQESQKNDKRNRWESGLGMVGCGGLKTDGFFSKVS